MSVTCPCVSESSKNGEFCVLFNHLIYIAVLYWGNSVSLWTKCWRSSRRRRFRHL